jgi:ATP-dependent Clp protease ATP-binding subunit ClpA
MFERYTNEARKVVIFAQDEARRMNHNYVGTEHLLLGALREKGIGKKVLYSLNVTEDGVRKQVETIVGCGEEGTREAKGSAPFTPRAKKVFEYALREALRLGHNYIGTEHILPGLVRESDGVAFRILSNLSDPEKVRKAVVALLDGTRATTDKEPQIKWNLKKGSPPPAIVIARLRKLAEKKEEEATLFEEEATLVVRKAAKALSEANRLRDALNLLAQVKPAEAIQNEPV